MSNLKHKSMQNIRYFILMVGDAVIADSLFEGGASAAAMLYTTTLLREVLACDNYAIVHKPVQDILNAIAC